MKKYVNRDNMVNEYDALMESLAEVKAGRKFSRDEMNER